MTRRDIFIFIAGCLLGCGITWLTVQPAPRQVLHLFPDRAPVLQAEPVAPNREDVSTDLQNESVRLLLQRLAKACNSEMVLSDKVQGSVIMDRRDLEKHPPREALEIVVQSQGLILHELDGKLFVKTAAEKAREPTHAATYTFRNARASDAVKILAKSLQSGVEPMADERTNTVFYRELRSNVPKIRELLEFLDQPLPPSK